MAFALTVNMYRKRQVLAGLEQVDLFLEEEGIGAEVDVFLSGHQSFNDLCDLGMHQRFAAGNGDHRRAALVHRTEALFRRKVLLEHVCWILDLAATGTRQVAAEQRLQHQHQRVALAAFDLLFEDVRGDRPHLRNRYTHAAQFPRLQNKNANSLSLLYVICAKMSMFVVTAKLNGL